jgi:hypothetical protein
MVCLAITTNVLVFGLTRSGLEPTIYRTRGEHANHYTTDTVISYAPNDFITHKSNKEQLYLLIWYHFNFPECCLIIIHVAEFVATTNVVLSLFFLWWFITRVTPLMPMWSGNCLHYRAPEITAVFSGILDAQYLVFCVLFRRQLLFLLGFICRFSFAHCIVYSCLIYDIIWLPVLYLQTFVVATNSATCIIIRQHSGKYTKQVIRWCRKSNKNTQYSGQKKNDK